MTSRTFYADLTNRTIIGATNSSFPLSLSPFFVGDTEYITFDCFYLNPGATTGPLYTESVPGSSTKLALGVVGSAPIVSATIDLTGPYTFTLPLTGTSASAALGSSNSASVTLELRIDGSSGLFTIQAPVTLQRRLNY
jgi:hypothetical protein